MCMTSTNRHESMHCFVYLRGYKTIGFLYVYFILLLNCHIGVIVRKIDICINNSTPKGYPCRRSSTIGGDESVDDNNATLTKRPYYSEKYSYIIITMFLQIIDVNVCRGRAVTNVGRSCGPTSLLN